MLVSLVLFVCVPGVARAASYSVPAGLPDPPYFAGAPNAGAEGPALAAGQVVWTEIRGRAGAVVAAAPGEPARDVLALGRVEEHGVQAHLLRIAAHGDRAVVQRVVIVCAGVRNRCDGPDRTVRRELLSIDLVTQTAVAFDGCHGSAACNSCRAGRHWYGFRFDLVASVFSTDDDCGQGSVHDFADQATGLVDGVILAAAGSYAVVAARTDFERNIRLVDWRTGRQIRRLPDLVLLGDEARQVTVGPDGTVAFVSGDRIRVIAPGGKATTLRRPARDEVIIDQVRIAGGLLAHRRVFRDDQAEDRDVFWISRFDGSSARRVGGQRNGGGWDFDGAHLTWATQPCAQIVVQHWDLAAAPPPAAAADCSTPTVDRRPVKMRRARTLPVTLTCPRMPAQGCAGQLHATLRLPRSHTELTETYLTPVRLPAGAQRTVRLKILRSHRLRALRRLQARVEFSSLDYSTQRTVRLDVSR